MPGCNHRRFEESGWGPRRTPMWRKRPHSTGLPDVFYGGGLFRSPRTHLHKAPFLHIVLLVALVVVAAVPASLGQSGNMKGGLTPLGICWGRISHMNIPPGAVVGMLKENSQISRVKLFSSDGEVLAALAELSDQVEVMIMVPNERLGDLALSDDNADGWVYTNLLAALPTGVNIRYISVGNEPYLFSQVQTSDAFLVLAVNRLQGALERAGLAGQIKITVSFNVEILGTSAGQASNATFVKQWYQQIKNITTLINNTGSFFSANIYPFFTYKDDQNVSISYIMMEPGHTVRDSVSGLTYTSLMDVFYDAFIYALTDIGFPNLEIRIGETGWPSDGHPVGNLSFARRYYQNVIAHLSSGQGTPKRPNKRIVFYLFALIDEDAKTIGPGPFERRFGLYNDVGTPKFKLDLLGQGNTNAELPGIPGLSNLTQRWCVVSSRLTQTSSEENRASLTTIVENVCGTNPYGGNFADLVDCTPMLYDMTSPGLQCSQAARSSPNTLAVNASYALNLFYQLRAQSRNSCTFGGFGTITYQDPSEGQCTFPVGLDIEAIESYFKPSNRWYWEVLGYLVALIVILATFL